MVSKWPAYWRGYKLTPLSFWNAARQSYAPIPHRPEPKSLLPSKYAQEKTTISMEVVEHPTAGAYDLKLTE